VITANPAMLQSYRDGRRRFAEALPRLAALAADDPPGQRRLIADIARLSQGWTETVAEPEIAAARAGVHGPLEELDGKRRMDAIRQDIAAFRQAEMRRLADRDRMQAQVFRTSRLTLVIGSGLALLFAGLIAGRSSWQQIAGRQAAEAAADRLEDALERAQAAERAKTLFLSNMSHEMRTPLNGVSGMAQALAQTQLDPAQRDLVRVIGSSAATLDGLISDLLALSRGDEIEDRPREQRAFHLGDAVRRIAAAYRVSAELKGLDLHVEVAAEANVKVLCDTARLRRLAGALLSNALKFTDRGQVTLRVRALATQRYRFEIEDTGIGFDEARKAQLFETFSQSDDSATRRYGGAGLGLALARRLADDLNGRLDCRSIPGEGSVFTFEIGLPTAEAEPELDAAQPAAEPTVEEAPLRMLVVDDNPTNRMVLEMILDPLGVEWVSVENGQQAVDAVRLGTFSAILMDIQMPVMDGLTATREIRRLEREAGRAATPVIVVSANGQPEHVQAGRAAGAQMHLTKPVSAEGLVNALNAVLADPAPEDEAAAA
jgi:signal transduction histidine kinase/CheY-like chemotaxis protein